MSRPRVFVVNEPLMWEGGEQVRALDLTPARDHGELIHVLPAGKLPHNMDVVVEQIKERMRDYRPDDILLLIGDPRAMAVAAAIAARRGGGRLRLLHWQRRQRTYDCVEIGGLYANICDQAA